MGKFIAILFLVGGVSIIRSMMRSEINMMLMVAGCAFLSVAVVLFILQLRKI